MSSSKKSNSKESIISTAKKPKSPPPPNSSMNWTPDKSSSRRTSVGSTKTPSPPSVKPNKSFNRKAFLNFIKKQKRKSPPKSPQESVASANTPLNPKEINQVSKRFKKVKISKNNTEIKRNRAVTKFINDPNARERLRVHNEAKRARNVYAIGPSRRAAAEAGVLQSNSKESGLTRVKKILFNKSSKNNKNNKNKGSVTKK